jgi:branched-chain amino acid transport system ATP-binding protein
MDAGSPGAIPAFLLHSANCHRAVFASGKENSRPAATSNKQAKVVRRKFLHASDGFKRAGYGDMKVLRDISLSVDNGEIISIVGANGAGKTTLINTISGLVTVTGGEILFEDQRIDRLPPHKVAELGIIQVPEGRKLFPFMSVHENLLMGSIMKRTRKDRNRNLEYVFELLPKLAERRTQISRTLSGGEQQMLAIGRAMMSMPKILMLDEPSLGLSPLLVSTVFSIINKISETGTTVLLVEQNVKQALRLSKRAYVHENGAIAIEGQSADLLDNPHVKKAYLGL